MSETKSRVTEQDVNEARRALVQEIDQRETLCFSNSGDVITIRQNWDVSGGNQWDTVMLTRPRAIEMAKKLLELATHGEVSSIRDTPRTH